MDSPFKFASSCQDAEFKVRDDGFKHCTYCGSLHPVELADLITCGRATLHGSDWKYGWPHKFYVAIDGKQMAGKFYSEHLLYATDDERKASIHIISEACNIVFMVDKGQLKYIAPYHGYQRQ